ncbi:hypothetical protein L596_002435 [Steinernema carpocapsae]|uniref:Uncharacterized protein n=1 Tax=Steinernema carpocapsae TaxID=34508 RepID=A0A4U8UPQ5_STECR|nr:hypothetical protein L596_002435 [Steinernema carpocapsae]
MNTSQIFTLARPANSLVQLPTEITRSVSRKVGFVITKKTAKEVMTNETVPVCQPENCQKSSSFIEQRCPDDTFSCVLLHSPGKSTHVCATEDWKCDGEMDCVGGIDEQGCNEFLKCSKNEMKCDDGECINVDWKCDGEFDCEDKSDEKDCPPANCTAAEFGFACVSNGLCVPSAFRCDGNRDCEDDSDEANCTEISVDRPHLKCDSSQFACKSGDQCIKAKWVCDGEYDCTDLSDETDCKLDKCKDDERTCDVGRCYKKDLWCDGKEDCFDGTDEVGCNGTKTPKSAKGLCTDTQHKCSEFPFACVDYRKLCINEENDCKPSVCNQTFEICERGTLNCDCRDTNQNGSVCYCGKGYELRGKRCIDINECAMEGMCDQHCVNLDGSYECHCYHGYYAVQEPGQSLRCHAIGREANLILATRGQLRQFNLRTRQYNNFVNPFLASATVDYIYRNNTFVWFDELRKLILQCQLNANKTERECMDSKYKPLVQNVTLVAGLKLDWVHNLMFWADPLNGTLNVMDLANGRSKTIVSKDFHDPHSLTIDPSEGLVFWTDWSKSEVNRVDMNGLNRMQVVGGEAVGWPSALTLDLLQKRLYWADAKFKILVSCDYNGQNAHRIFSDHQHLHHPFSMVLFEDRLFWTDRDNGVVLAVDKFSGHYEMVMAGPASGPIRLGMYHHEASQPLTPNKCAVNECGPKEICLPQSPPAFASGKEVLSHECFCVQGTYRKGKKCVSSEIDVEDPKPIVKKAKEEEHAEHTTARKIAFALFFIFCLILAMIMLRCYKKRNHEQPIYEGAVGYRRYEPETDEWLSDGP